MKKVLFNYEGNPGGEFGPPLRVSDIIARVVQVLCKLKMRGPQDMVLTVSYMNTL